MRLRIPLLVLLCLLPGALLAEPALRFAPLPMESKDTLIEEYLGPVHYLGEKLGRAIELVYSKDYQELLTRFRRDEIDFALIGPLPYLMLTQDFDAAIPLVRMLEPGGRDHYTCVMAVFGDTPLTPARMRGMRLALPDPLSTCAELSMAPMLAQAGVDFDETKFCHYNTHDQAALAVILDQADAAGLKDGIARNHASLGLRVVASSPPVPGFVLVANAHTMPDTLREALREALLALRPQEDAKDAERMRDWGRPMRYGAVPARDADFFDLRQQLMQRPLMERKPCP